MITANEDCRSEWDRGPVCSRRISKKQAIELVGREQVAELRLSVIYSNEMILTVENKDAAETIWSSC